MTNSERLHFLMDKYSLSRLDVARILHRPVDKRGRATAVDKWLASARQANHRQMDDAYMELLEYKLDERPVRIWTPSTEQ